MTLRWFRYFPPALALLLLPVSCLWAQSSTTGAIAGVARDTTGAVLPGVTVEAASPALIEKVRVAVTDGQGQYKIVDLRPGTYAVTFTLPGFSIFKHEGVELTTGFTATVNGEMRVGGLQETVTVTGASPVVDVQNVRSQTVLSRQTIDTLPSGRTVQGYATLTLGAVLQGTGALQDVGGDRGESAVGFGVHGVSSLDSRMEVDGMIISAAFSGQTQNRLVQVNAMGVQEVSLTTRGASAESEVGGVLINHVPRDGGNTFHFSFLGNGANGSMQSQRLNDALRARGLTTAPALKQIYDVGVGFGGPIKRDKLWFYLSDRWWRTQSYGPGNYWANKTDPAARGGLIYIPDLSRPAYTELCNEDYGGRPTWQAAAKHKIAAYFFYQRVCNAYIFADQNLRPEAGGILLYRPKVLQVIWNYPRTNRLLFDVGTTVKRATESYPRQPEVSRKDISVFDLSTGFLSNSAPTGLGPGGFLSYQGPFNHNHVTVRAAVSYVTGSHAFKAGLSFLIATEHHRYDLQDPPLGYIFFNNRPVALTQWASPAEYRTQIVNTAPYVQDQWTVRRLTLNLGVRFILMKGLALAQDIEAGPFVPARHFPAVDDIPNYKDVTPRVGASYDLSGDGKTAVKFSAGRYLTSAIFGEVNANLPLYRTAISAFRTWTDANGNYIPDCNLLNRAANDECGPMSAPLGDPIPVTQWADDAIRGFGIRPYTWQTTATVQHELRQNVAVTGGYYRTWYGNFTVTDNRAITPANYDPYCVTVPVDARLPGGGGNQLCGLFDLNPSKFGVVDKVITQASHFGTQTQVYNGVEVAFNARFGEGGLLQGGMSTGQTVDDNCLVYDSPMAFYPGGASGFGGSAQTLPNTQCQAKMPFRGQTQYKASAIYPLPWYGIQLSGVFQNVPGIPLRATFNAPSSATTLGRALTTGTAAIDLLEPNTQFEPRLTQVDLRVSKILRFGRGKVQGNFDLFNVFNARKAVIVNTTYGPTWLQPRSVLGGRLIKLGAQVDF